MESKKSTNEVDDAFIGGEQDWTNLLRGGWPDVPEISS